MDAASYQALLSTGLCVVIAFTLAGLILLIMKIRGKA